MARLLKKRTKPHGSVPGAVVFVGDRRQEHVGVKVIDYDATQLTEKTLATVEEAFPFKDSPTVSWIDICGLHDASVIEKIGAHFGLHALVLEDIANTGQRPKFEESQETLFLVVKMLYLGGEDGELEAEQVSILAGKNFVISFQERDGDVFEPVRERIRKAVPRKRFLGADYLAYALIDAIVDNYFTVLEYIGDKIEVLQDELLENPSPEYLETIHGLKRALIDMRKRVWPLREVIGGLERSESKLIHDFTRPYLRDLYEHTIQVIDTVETARDMVSSLLDIYLSSVSNRMNEVMKVLTIIATIFIPLGFLAGVFGMNFNPESSPFNMPELNFRFGYPLFWALVLMVGGGLFIFFKRKRWI
ncbi:MAG: magnesium/cobalt transporter CorA [bacterium]